MNSMTPLKSGPNSPTNLRIIETKPKSKSKSLPGIPLNKPVNDGHLETTLQKLKTASKNGALNLSLTDKIERKCSKVLLVTTSENNIEANNFEQIPLDPARQLLKNNPKLFDKMEKWAEKMLKGEIFHFARDLQKLSAIKREEAFILLYKEMFYKYIAGCTINVISLSKESPRESIYFTGKQYRFMESVFNKFFETEGLDLTKISLKLMKTIPVRDNVKIKELKLEAINSLAVCFGKLLDHMWKGEIVFDYNESLNHIHSKEKKKQPICVEEKKRSI